MTPPAAVHSSNAEELRKETNFHPSLWGDFFLTYQPPTAPKRESMKERAEVLREEVRKILKGPKELSETLNLIVTIQRLGLESYYEDEIDEILHGVYNSDNNDKDLNLVSLRFYLLRKNCYDVPSDVFLKFKTKDGNFVAADTRSLLSLYNAAYLRTRNEKVLDEAISYTRSCLQDALQPLESPLAEEVSSSLDMPLFKKVGIMEARNYISIYEKEPTRNEAILEFAKLNFNLQQLVFCEEIKECTMWWKDMQARSKLSFVRDRIVEMYFWMNGACSDPPYSHSRIIMAKITAFITIIDDMFDTYGTTEECLQIAEAIIYRWDESAVPLLPEYVKGFYLCLLETFNTFEDALGPEKSYRVFYLKEKMKHLVQLYCKEIKWRDEDYVPTLSEYIQVTMESIGSDLLACAAFVGMGDIITKETFEWLLSYPQLIKSYGTFVRLSNDLVSTQREQTGDHCPSSVQCYMKEHGTTMHDANEKIKELTEDSWKEMIKLSLELKEQPKLMSQTVIALTRTAVYMYNQCDAFTSSETIKEMIRLLFVEPIPQ